MTAETNTDDFYARLVELAEQGQSAEAVKRVLGLNDITQQMNILQRVAGHLEHDMVFAENLDFASDFFLKWMYARDNAAALAGFFNRDAAQPGTDTGLLVRAHVRAQRLALILADPARHSAREQGPAAQKSRAAHDRLIQLNEIIVGVLNELMAAETTYPAAASQPASASAAPVTVRLRGIETLSPQHLAAQVVPYLQALADIHAAVDRVTDEEGRAVKILALSAGETLEITFEADNSIVESLGILQGVAFRQHRREYRLRKAALAAQPDEAARAEKLRQETAEHIVRAVVNQIFHLPLPVPASTLKKFTITRQMRSLKIDIQQKTLTVQLLQPIALLLESPLEVVEVIHKD